jgi:radical SAM protein with 4Fe4S-binding SPASM domain
MSFPQESKPIRFSRRQEVLRQSVINAEPTVLLPDPAEWREVDAVFDRESRILVGNRRDESVLLESPTFTLPPATTVYFSLFVESQEPCGLQLSLQSSFETVADRAVFGVGELALSFRFASRRGGKFNLYLAGHQPGTATRVKARIVRLTVRAITDTPTPQRSGSDLTCLPHWTRWQRRVHALCGKSRWINAAVATWEMHLGHEELLSLPQYMAICPTGQCNASCGFCSVTTNRTGVIKKQLPFEALDRFLSPVFGSLRLFGLEGNGEPTLYDRFDELLFRVTSRGAAVYLISNGERLTADQIALLLASPTDAINFSLNAATAETHRRVMKLKGWDTVIQNISRFVRWRGDATAPLLSVSMVVTRDNAHEVQQFLHFAEWQLKVDRILIRPLSEIANDSGVIEDLRELVPYESQINDLLDAVAEYLEYVPRRAEIVIDPTAFNAFRLEPRGVIISPPGFEDQLLAPRRTDWLVESDQVETQWRLNRLEISADATGILVRSRVIPVATGQKMTFRCRAQIRTGTLKVVISDESANVLGTASATASDKADLLAIEFDTPSKGGVMIELHACDPSAQVQIDFGQLYSGPVLESSDIKLPHSSRWQMDMPGTSVRWEGNELSLEAQAQPGLYLYRSYKVPALPEESITVAVQVRLERGALGIGILSDDGNEWMASARFESGTFPTEIVFNTGRHCGFQVVLYALTDDPLRARIDWGNNLGAVSEHKSRLIEPRQLLMPIPSRWIVDTPGANVHWRGNSVQIAWDGAKSLYLLHSPPFPCPQLRRPMAKVSLLATVTKGQLGIGFLGGQSKHFASLSFFAVGEHNATIEIDSYGQSNLTVVLFSDSLEPLEATVDWGESLQLELDEAQNDWRGGLFDPRENAARSREDQSLEPDGGVDPKADETKLSALVKAPGIPGRIANIYMRAGLSGVVRKAVGFLARRASPPSLSGILGLSFSRLSGMAFNSLLKRRFPKASIYCQKPWTDLNNFTVDGRMDVCCITTGPSQERYALGNIFEQDFQQIWNGERMKEFRRTVNAKDKLPPCARCPMANNYKPPF